MNSHGEGLTVDGIFGDIAITATVEKFRQV